MGEKVRVSERERKSEAANTHSNRLDDAIDAEVEGAVVAAEPAGRTRGRSARIDDRDAGWEMEHKLSHVSDTTCMHAYISIGIWL